MAATDSVGVLLAVPTRGTVRIEWAAMLAGLAAPVNMTRVLKIIPGLSVEEARNVAVVTALEQDAEYLFFVDDDVLCPNQTMRRFIWHMEQNPNWDVVSGIVPIKSQPIEPCIFKDGRPGPYWGWTFNETFEIDACGMACAMIRTSVFAKIDEPWFEWVRGMKGADTFEEGEDVGFCRKVKEAGGRIFADGGVLCGHMDADGKTYMLPLDCAPLKRGAEALKGQTILEMEKVA
jgi:GT2 family glycosyltransferase